MLVWLIKLKVQTVMGVSHHQHAVRASNMDNAIKRAMDEVRKLYDQTEVRSIGSESQVIDILEGD